MCACVVHVGLQKLLESLLIYLLQADDVGVEPQDLLQHKGPPVLRSSKPAPEQEAV